MRAITRVLRLCAACIVLALPFGAGAQSQPQAGDDGYAGMLGYLTGTRITDQAFRGASGAIAINMAAGDGNLQLNQRAVAVGPTAGATALARQVLQDNTFDAPDVAVASIEGDALAGAAGLVSINQASGHGNVEANLVTAALAAQGIREAADGLLSAVGASVEERGAAATAADVAREDAAMRAASVSGSALRGFSGVLQLNQVAGSGNAVDNRFALSVGNGP